MWRDPEGRGLVLRGAPNLPQIDGPQIAAVAMVLAGALLLRERKSAPQQSNAQASAPDPAPTTAQTDHHPEARPAP
jgi:hypothetical protein